MRSFIAVNLKATGFHNWGAAPKEVQFLGSTHRHTFHIRVKVIVGHDDREVEFTMLKRVIEFYLEKAYHRVFDGFDFGGNSCEMLSRRLFDYLLGQDYAVLEVSFSEDGEFEGGVCSQEN